MASHGGRSWGMYRHAEPVRTIHLRARFEDLAQIVVALRGVLSEECQVGATNAHSSSETSLGYGFLVAMPRCYRVRARVHNTLYAPKCVEQVFSEVRGQL